MQNTKHKKHQTKAQKPSAVTAASITKRPTKHCKCPRSPDMNAQNSLLRRLLLNGPKRPRHRRRAAPGGRQATDHADSADACRRHGRRARNNWGEDGARSPRRGPGGGGGCRGGSRRGEPRGDGRRDLGPSESPAAGLLPPTRAKAGRLVSREPQGRHWRGGPPPLARIAMRAAERGGVWRRRRRWWRRWWRRRWRAMRRRWLPAVGRGMAGMARATGGAEAPGGRGRIPGPKRRREARVASNGAVRRERRGRHESLAHEALLDRCKARGEALEALVLFGFHALLTLGDQRHLRLDRARLLLLHRAHVTQAHRLLLAAVPAPLRHPLSGRCTAPLP